MHGADGIDPALRHQLPIGLAYLGPEQRVVDPPRQRVDSFGYGGRRAGRLAQAAKRMEAVQRWLRSL
jgi:hypothetical protein